jgi:CSLREA domain-containing protein
LVVFSMAVSVTSALLQLSMAPARAATTFTVDSTADAVDANIGDGACAASGGACTLRAAIQESNALAGPDTVNLPAGTYLLSLATPAEDFAASGDLDVTSPLTLVGVGAASTIVDVAANDRVLHVHPVAGNVTLSGLTLRNGVTDEGGGILNASSGTLRLDAVTVTGNEAVGDGGGIHNVTGTLLVNAGSVISNNAARNGGGIYSAGEPNEAGTPSRVTITNAIVTGNRAIEGGGGGVWSDHEASLSLASSTFSGNTAADNGGGVAVVSKSGLVVSGGTFADNAATGDGGGIYAASEAAVTIGGVVFTTNAAGVVVAGEGEGSGGGLFIGGSSAASVTGSTFTGNTASGEGGGLAIDNNGSVSVTASEVRGNEAGAGGGGIENAGARVTLSGLVIAANRAHLDGGGIESQGSGQFTLVDSTVQGNTAENGGGFANAADGATLVARTTFWDNRAVVGSSDDAGLGGGIYGLGDAAAEYENITITGNFAQMRGGGFYVDADAPVRMSSSTVSRNSAPVASGVGGEIGSVNFPVQPSTAVILRNTIVAGNLLGPNCSFAVGSEGGNIQGDSSCHLTGPRDRTAADPGLDAIADNGGSTMTMAIRPESLALDGGVSPCPTTDQRGVTRPLNVACDSGAFESEGPFPPADLEPPDTIFLEGPIQDTEATSLFRFTGTDNATAPEHLTYECRLLEFDPTEVPEVPDPTAPPEPELAFLGCLNPWQVPIIEEGTFTFEVRAIDRAGNVDPTPAVHLIEGALDLTPPDTLLLETPTNPSTRNTATFTFTGTDNQTPVQFMEFECRIDSTDPEAWLECTNPAVFSNLVPGTHVFQVRATDGADNIDPTPATFTWTIGTATDCASANITLFAADDGWIDESLPLDNFQLDTELVVRSQAPGSDAHSLIRFDLPTLPSTCTLQSATLRLFGEGDSGRTLHAVPITSAWSESQVTWNSAPSASGTPATATSGSGSGYREWNVTSHVTAFIGGSTNHGWLVSDAAEEDLAGAEQSFLSSEAVTDPPTPPQLVLRFDAAGTLAPPPPPEPGSASTVVCGQVITESTTLANDVVGCLGEGLVVGAPNIVIDLNGHTVRSGLVIEPGEEDGLFAGIRNSGHANVVIRNGTVRDFGYGVRLMGGAVFNVIESVTFHNNINAGVEMFDADDGRNGNTVRNSTFTLNGDGVALVFGSEGSVVEGNTFSGNVGRALYLFDARGHRVQSNTISGLTNDPLIDSDGGIYLEGSSDNALLDNFISDTGDAAFVITAGSNRNFIVGNTSTRSSDSGITIADSDGTIVVDNVLHLAGGAGMSLSGANDGEVRGNDVRFNPGGIELSGSSGNLIEANDVSSSLSDGIAVGGGSVGNQIIANIANRTNATGITVESDAVGLAGNVIDGNQANANLGDGIAVVGAGHTITGNSAHDNAAWGIQADVGNTDGGGNTASGNGEPPQCEGVVCGPGSGPPVVPPDLTPPETVLDSTPVDGASTASPHTFTFSGSDDVAPTTALRYECRLDAPPDPPAEPPEPPEPGEPPEPVEPPASETWHECGSPVIYSLLLAGEHTFEVRAIDPSDNIDLTPASFTWTVVASAPGPDALAPETTISSGPSDPTTSTSATFAFRGTDNATPGPNLVFECALDDGDFVACTTPTTYTGLDVGAHTFVVRATDLAGNADPTPASFTWTIQPLSADVTPPETTLGSTPDATTVSITAVFEFTSDEAGSTFECSLGGAAFAACTSPATYTSLAVSAHTFAVRAVDASGNLDATPATYSWTVTPAAVPTALSCGEVVTSSVILTSDLVGCLGDGLVVGADSITIDLDGYTISGTGLGAGVRNEGHRSVTIRNGIVAGFDDGVVLGNGTALNIVEAMTAQLNELAGISLTNADDGVSGNILRSNVASGNGTGIALLAGTTATLLQGNTVAGSSGEGIRVQGSTGNRIVDNDIVGTSDAGLVLEGASSNVVVGNAIIGTADAGLVIQLGSDDNLVEDNVVTDSESGVVVIESTGNQVLANVIHGMGDSGIVLEIAHESLLRGNDVRFNSGGIEVSGSTNNRIESNDASETSGSGIELESFSLSNVVVSNNVSFNDAHGISIGDSAGPGSGNLLDRNTASGNGADGIYVGAVGHVIMGNSAMNNSGWGIYAAAGTVAGVNVDGGGNRAAGNTVLEQCFNVSCDGGPPIASDLEPPETSFISTPSASTVFSTAMFGFTGTDNATAVTFQCRLDSVSVTDFAACTSPHALTGLGLGVHTFEVRAVDFIGNVDPTPATHTWTVVLPAPGVAPDTTITSSPDATTVNTSASFGFVADEPGVTFECALDAAAFATCASPQTYTGLGVGPHAFAVRAVDGESNVDSTPASFSWQVTAAPVLATVTCGQVITQSTRVSNSLVDCGGNGLVIGAHGITLDLNGRTIDGIGTGAGILNNGFDSVTITNGFVQEFDFGVQLNSGTTQNIVSSLTAQLNQEAGIALSDADGSTVRQMTITENAIGIHVANGTTGAVLLGNTVSASSGDGILVDGSSSNRIEGNTVTTSSLAGVALLLSGSNTVVGNTASTNSGDGISVGDDGAASDGNRIEANTLTGNSGAGIAVIDSIGNELVGNVAQQHGGAGVALTGASGTLVRGNDARFNAGGIELSDSTDNRIEANDASSSNGTGLSVEGLSTGNVIVLNTASGNSGDGISVDATAPAGSGNLIDRNTANSNSGDGISVNAAVHTIVGNVANANDGWGMLVVPGNVDGGGNAASGNAEPTQCSGVACLIGPAPGAPDTSLVLRPTDPTNSRNALFTFTGTDNTTLPVNLGFECRLDSTSDIDWIECDNPQEYSALSAGEHRFEVRAVDEAGNVDPSPATHTWTYVPLPAGVAPDTFIGLAPPLQSPLLDAIFTFTSNEPDVTFECSIDLGPFAPCEFAVEISFEETEVGQHSFRVRATDFEGNVDPTPAEHLWTITGVITTFESGPAEETEETAATFVFFANVADATFECSLDLGPFVACTSPLSVSGLAVGDHLLRVIATDDEGVSEIEPAEYEWTVVSSLDTTPPTAQITTAGDPIDANGSITFSFTGSDNVTSAQGLIFECSLDDPTDAGFAACTSPWTIPNPDAPDALTAGPHTFYVRAIDAEDNIGDPVSLAFVYAGDTVAPLVTGLSGPPTTTALVDVLFTFASNDPFATFECSVDGELFEACESPHQVQGVLAGPHELSVRAVDLASNVGPVSTYSWTLSAPPVTTLADAPAAITASTTATFGFVADQAGVTFRCSLDGGLLAPCTSPVVLSDLSGGAHTFAVQATNGLGQVELDPVEHAWTVDVPPPPPPTPPETSIDTGPDLVTTSTSATFTFSADIAGSTFACSIDEGAFAPCTSPVALSDLLVGEHTFEVQATDPDGEVDATPASFEWDVVAPPPADTTAPQTAVASGPAATTTDTTAAFELTATEEGSTFECSLDGAAFAACTSPVELTGLSLGAHVFSVRATDAAGNTDATPAAYGWTVEAPADLTPPETTVTGGPGASTESTTATFTLSAGEPGSSYECSLNGAPFAVCTSPVTLSALAVGTHTFAVRAIDAAGNTDPTPAVHSWTVVAPPPNCGTTVTLNASADAWIDQGSPSNNNGSDSNLKVMSKGPSSNLRALVRFNLPALPAGCVVSTATLRVYAASAASGRTLQALRVDGAWTEGGLTWNNQPPASAAASTTSGSGYRQWAVAAQVQSMYTSGQNNGFLIRDAVENQDAEQQFNSREKGENLPQLVVTFGVAPPPDTTAPDTTALAGPGGATTATSATFEFGATEAGSTFACSLDGAAFTACTSPAQRTSLAVGGHTFEVRATDPAGNVDTSPVAWAWTVEAPPADTSPPDTSISSGPPASTTSAMASFAFGSTETSTYECSLDGAPFAECYSPVSLSALAVGSHTFAVRAIDGAGNVDGSPALHTWSVLAAPTVDCGAAITLNASADAWIDQGSGSSNKGTDSVLKVMSKRNTANRALVRFDLPAAPAGCVIESATLRLYASSSRNGRTLQALRVTGAWTESGVTWNNQPATTGAPATTSSGSGYRSWDVATMVRGMYDTGNNNGFLIRDADESRDHEQQFHAREKGSNVPQLVVRFIPA